MKPASLMRWFPNSPENELHAHSADAVVQSFCAALKSWRSRRNSDPTAKPPKRRRRYFKVIWKSSAIRVRGGKLVLSNGKTNPPVVISWAWETPVQVEIGWDGKQYELRACYDPSKRQAERKEEETPKAGEVAGVDLGEVHLAVAHDGKETFIANGRLLRSQRRYQNKLKGKLSRLMARKKRDSRRRKRLVRSKQRQLARLAKQMADILHKQTTRLVSTLQARGVQTVVIGDIRDIRRSAQYNKAANQKIHQMLSGQVRRMLTYKAEQLGMRVVLQEERYTSQKCPRCNMLHKPSGREYHCRAYGFRFHRDGVGAVNLRRKYLGQFDVPVVGVMASPIGLRYWPHAQCSPASESRFTNRERIPRL
ncbi:RNA-guided endonuclease InsQ/TnpB family protein [Synechococcus sp. R6-6]|uniref:RNA-guided endonuclease InsQ/TnpB family protein n=1 Tax=unclassified Synechococcus TaxID=2626047 RepID=UPI0039C3447E